MKLGKTYFSGSLTFDEGTNTLGPNSSNITGSFSGSLKGTITATGDIIPAVSGAYNLGSTAFPFKDLYITQNSLKFIDDTTGSEIGRISVNSNTGDIKLLNTKNLTEEQKATLTAENVGAEALSPVSASAIWVSQSISPGHTNTSIGHTNQKFHTVHTQYVSASSTAISGDLTVGGKVTAQEFHTEFVSASIIYESGSTQFGNSADDTHIFTGNISIGTSDQYGKFSLLGTDNTELTTSRIGISSTSGVVASIYNTDQTANSFAGLQLITRNSSASHWGIFNKSVGASDGTLVIGHGSGGTGFERIVVTSDGKVGIGTTSPAAKLHINHNSTTLALTYGNSVANNPLHTAFYGGWSGIGMDQTTAGIRLAGDAGSGNPIVDMGYYSSFTVSHANWNSLMIVRQNGNVGIGTISPGYTFTVAKSITDNWIGLINNTYDGAGNGLLIDAGNGSSGEILRLRDRNGYSKVSFLSNGNVGIGTTSPAAKLDINGSVRYRGSIYDETTFNASGNYSLGTYYTMVTASTIAEGVYIITGYVDTYNSGGGIYYMKFATVPFYFWNAGSNSTTYTDIPEPIGTGHHKGANLPLFRLQHQLGASGGNVFLQFNPNANWTGMDGTGGKTFYINLKRLSGV